MGARRTVNPLLDALSIRNSCRVDSELQGLVQRTDVVGAFGLPPSPEPELPSDAWLWERMVPALATALREGRPLTEGQAMKNNEEPASQVCSSAGHALREWDRAIEDLLVAQIRYGFLGRAIDAMEGSKVPSESSPPPAPASTPQPASDRWIKVGEAARITSKSEKWFYNNWKKLGFASKRGGKCLRFSEPGLQRWMEDGKRA